MTKQTLNTTYQIAPQLWDAITSEVNRLLPSIQSGEEFMYNPKFKRLNT